MKINEAVRRMHPARYTTAQAAELVGRDKDTLKRWQRANVHHPSDSKEFGRIVVKLYTDDDIAELRKIVKTMKPGRKKSE